MGFWEGHRGSGCESVQGQVDLAGTCGRPRLLKPEVGVDAVSKDSVKTEQTGVLGSVSLRTLSGGRTGSEQGQSRRGLTEKVASTCPPCLTCGKDTQPSQGRAEGRAWLHPIPMVALRFTHEGLPTASCLVIIHRYPWEEGLEETTSSGRTPILDMLWWTECLGAPAPSPSLVSLHPV